MMRECNDLHAGSQVGGTDPTRHVTVTSAGCHSSRPLPPSDQQQGLHRQDVLRASALQRVCLAQEEAPEERRTSVSVAVL